MTTPSYLSIPVLETALFNPKAVDTYDDIEDAAKQYGITAIEVVRIIMHHIAVFNPENGIKYYLSFDERSINPYEEDT